MVWHRDGFYSKTANEITWSREITADAKLVFNMVASSLGQPVFLPYSKVHAVTGWSDKRISKAIKELVRRKIILCRPGGLRFEASEKRKASEYSINPNRREWQIGEVNPHPCTSLPPWKREKTVASNGKVCSLPSGKTNKECKRNGIDTTERARSSPLAVAPIRHRKGMMNCNSTSEMPTLASLSTAINHKQVADIFRPETEEERQKRENAEIEHLAHDPDLIEAFGSLEKVRAHFRRERGIDDGAEDGPLTQAKDGEKKGKQHD